MPKKFFISIENGKGYYEKRKNLDEAFICDGLGITWAVRNKGFSKRNYSFLKKEGGK